MPQFPSMVQHKAWGAASGSRGVTVPMAPTRTESPEKAQEILPKSPTSGSTASKAELPAFPRGAARPVMGQDVLELPPPAAVLGVTRGPKTQSKGVAVLPASPKLVALRWVIPATAVKAQVMPRKTAHGITGKPLSLGTQVMLPGDSDVPSQ